MIDPIALLIVLAAYSLVGLHLFVIHRWLGQSTPEPASTISVPVRRPALEAIIAAAS